MDESGLDAGRVPSVVSHSVSNDVHRRVVDGVGSHPGRPPRREILVRRTVLHEHQRVGALGCSESGGGLLSPPPLPGDPSPFRQYDLRVLSEEAGRHQVHRHVRFDVGDSSPAAAAAREVSGLPHPHVKERACRRTQSNEASSDRVVSESLSIQSAAGTSTGHDSGPVCNETQQPAGPVCEPLSGSEGLGSGRPVNPLGVSGLPVRLPSSPDNPSRSEEDPGGESSSGPDGGAILALSELVPRHFRDVGHTRGQTAPETHPYSSKASGNTPTRGCMPYTLGRSQGCLHTRGLLSIRC
jgi:hypothetical protein